MDDHPPVEKMMAETEYLEVEVSIAEEKCQFGLNSGNGISRHDQANDHKNSYVDVTEVDGLDDDVVNNVDVAEADGPNDDVAVDKNVVAEGSSASLESNTTVDDQVSEVDAQIEKQDAVNEELNEPLNEEENGNASWMDEFPPLVSRGTMKQESSLNDGHGFHVCLANSLEEHNGITNSWLDVVKRPHKHIAVKVKPRCRGFSGSSRGKITSDVSIACRTEVFGSSDVENDDAASIALEMGDGDQDMRHQLDIKLNASSTVQRLDGHSVGPVEEPPTLSSFADDGVDRVVSTPAEFDSESQIPTLEAEQETTVENVIAGDPNEEATNKETTGTFFGAGLIFTSSDDTDDEAQQEELKKSAEDDELRWREEEMRWKAVEAMLKEPCWSEELVKANEERERRRRQAEKKREKRLRKKERKKAAARDAHDIKRKSISQPLCGQNKNIYRQWVLAVSMCLVIFAVLWVRNTGMFPNVRLNWPSLN